MDVSVSKPIMVTSGIDKSIRIWNYIENNVEIINYFPEPAQCVAIHPNGLYLLVGFNSTLKLMAILMDDIRPYWEHNVRGTREVEKVFNVVQILSWRTVFRDCIKHKHLDLRYLVL